MASLRRVLAAVGAGMSSLHFRRELLFGALLLGGRGAFESSGMNASHSVYPFVVAVQVRPSREPSQLLHKIKSKDLVGATDLFFEMLKDGPLLPTPAEYKELRRALFEIKDWKGAEKVRHAYPYLSKGVKAPQPCAGLEGKTELEASCGGSDGQEQHREQAAVSGKQQGTTAEYYLRQVKCVEEILSIMNRKGIEPDISCYNTLLSARAKAGDAAGAFAVLEEMEAAEIVPDLATYSTLLEACAGTQYGEIVLDIMKIQGMIRRDCNEKQAKEELLRKIAKSGGH
ncbi:unnamed protein product [Amoebophrya sp. A120]|nr:unnamed protein product [Amoebophrya sp. A120]|eukprot:GSA120T00023170001.1